jgi:hypothetical protein
MPVDNEDIETRLTKIQEKLSETNVRRTRLQEMYESLLSVQQQKNRDGSDKPIMDSSTLDPMIPARRQKVYDTVTQKMDIFLS